VGGEIHRTKLSYIEVTLIIVSGKESRITMKSALISRFFFVAVMVLCLAAAMAGIALVPKPAEAQPWMSLQIEQPQWIEADYQGFDSFYGQDVVAYKEGGTAILTAAVWNGFDNDANVLYARLQFGWGGDAIEATTKPTKIVKGTYSLFEWRFTVPVASSLVAHSWEVTVRCDIESDPILEAKDSTSGSNFVVYTADQAECRDSIRTWNANNEAYTIWGYKGREMMTEAVLSFNKGEEQYAVGDFADAKTSFADAVTKQDEAIKADAKSALTDQTAESLRGTGGTKGTAYLIAGIGVLLAGVGVMVGGLLWGLKGRKAG
jgi:hypothetical protein